MPNARAHRAATVLRERRRANRAHRDMTQRVKVSDYLTVLGMEEADIDRYGSWAGRHIANAYRAANYGHNPRTTRKRTKPCSGHPKGRWIKVFVYRITDPALIIGCASYKRTAPFVQGLYAPAA
ncbi:hypothetical protein GTY75_09135 [Streptomyces sp. SID8381]|uniref:hypothetical protein n=1 Tax=unclassified Streptomyces TaxID=2593676 RepID=UPI00036186C9|nr:MULTISPECIES: hypothetical protein [unclassified Streptomyces]MYX26830.1 hypothetical protein [Streptomyces sp. SID8381]